MKTEYLVGSLQVKMCPINAVDVQIHRVRNSKSDSSTPSCLIKPSNHDSPSLVIYPSIYA